MILIIDFVKIVSQEAQAIDISTKHRAACTPPCTTAVLGTTPSSKALHRAFKQAWSALSSGARHADTTDYLGSRAAWYIASVNSTESTDMSPLASTKSHG
jgi:hypothetical protein